ncbi:hypothetical protein ABZW18_26955 [Streptomyces sp. NPDC004647]|uniref:hypothetical protein n=1 Tax=Streptomyces sp. NPDC004647 TaxID=3154671 RepID=UPI0033A462CC
MNITALALALVPPEPSQSVEDLAFLGSDGGGVVAALLRRAERLEGGECAKQA